MNPAAPTTTLVFPVPCPPLFGRTPGFVCRAKWRTEPVYVNPLETVESSPQPFPALLASEQGLSVIPKSICDGLRIAVRPIANWTGRAPIHHGRPCRVGWVVMFLTLVDQGYERQFGVRALIPNDDHALLPPCILLGTEFFRQYRVRLVLDCRSLRLDLPCGELVIP